MYRTIPICGTIIEILYLYCWEVPHLFEGITIGDKTLREHLEVVNHRDAISYVEEIVQMKESLSEWQIKNLHRLILRGIHDEYAGVYRK